MPQSGLLVRKPADQLCMAIGFCTIGPRRFVPSERRWLNTGVVKRSVSRIRNLNRHAVEDTISEGLALKHEWLTADLHPSLIPQGFSPLGQGHPRHSRFETTRPCETKP
jgi:hypothetical protein